MVISYSGHLQPCLLHEHKKLTDDKKNSIKSLLLTAGHFFGLSNFFIILFSQHGTLDMLKWMKEHKMVVDIENTDSYKHISTCCSYNALEISIIEGHKATSIWLKQQSDDWTFKFADVIFWCYIYNDEKLKTKKNIGLIKNIYPDSIFTTSDINEFAGDIFQYERNAYFKPTMSKKRFAKSLTKYLTN